MRAVALLGLSASVLALSACAAAKVPVKPDPAAFIAHRGDSLEAPQNTLPAFKRALDGGYGIELDLYRTHDDVIYLTHDLTPEVFKRKYGLTKAATNYFWRGELEKADAGKWFAKKWAGTPFARLDDVLAIVPPGRRVIFDLKFLKGNDAHLLRETVNRHPQIRGGDIILFGADAEMRKCFPDSKYGWACLVRRGWKKDDPPVPVEELIANARRRQVHYVSARWDAEVLTASYIKKINDAGFEVHTWSPNDPRDVALAQARGVKMFTSDSPRRLQGIWEDALSAAPAVPAGAYRMMVFNIWGPFFGNPVCERLSNVVETVRHESPDVMGFQEMTPEWWQSGLVEELAGMGYAAVPAGWEAKARHHNATPLFYRRDRLEVMAQGRELFHFKLDHSKGYAWALLRDRKTQKAFTAFSTHFWWKENGPESDVVRLQNAERLVSGLDRIRAIVRTPVIGGGDFNMREGADALRYLTDRGFSDAQKVAAIERSPHASCHDDPVRDYMGVFRGHMPERGRDTPAFSLDHILVGQGAKVLRQRIVRTVEAMDASDHSPVSVDFTLP